MIWEHNDRNRLSAMACTGVQLAALCTLALLCALVYQGLCFKQPAFAANSTAFTNLAGTEARDTAIEISKATFADGAATNVIVARDDDFADAMSSTGLAGQLSAPILLIDRNTGVNEALTAELARLGAKNIYVIGGPGAIPADIATQLGSSYHTERIYGTEASDTSVKCAQKLIELTRKAPAYAVVAMSDNFQDALSMSSFAYAHKAPIILETSGTTAAERRLPEGALIVLNNASENVFIAGGSGALSDASLNDISATKVRLWGEDGYDTSNQIATYMTSNNLLSASTIVVANGAEAAKGTDALAGAALAGKQGGALLLVQGHTGGNMGAVDYTTVKGYDSQNAPSFLTTHTAEVEHIYALGGTYVMPNECQVIIKDAAGMALTSTELTLLNALKAYDGIVGEYRNALTDLRAGTADLSQYPHVLNTGVLEGYKTENYCYTLRDINADGVPELFVGENRWSLFTRNRITGIIDIWSFTGTQPVRIAQGWMRGYYQLCENNVIRYDCASDSVNAEIVFATLNERVLENNDSLDFNNPSWRMIGGILTKPNISNPDTAWQEASDLYTYDSASGEWVYQRRFAESSSTYTEAFESLDAELQSTYPLDTSVEWVSLAS